MLKEAYATLICAVLASICDATVTFETYNVSRFMNTTSPIWTYISTDPHVYYKCKVDTVEEITETYVYFNRTYEDTKSAQVTEQLEGTFEKGNSSVMRVGDRGLVREYVEDLLFSSSDYRCGVFAVKYPGTTEWYDLRFKGTNGTGRPQDTCLEYFGSKKGVRHFIYGAECKTPK
uniref:Lipocalin n=1 Tax=Rhipicephalus zambeziensis TaxID=60191 RepID=A0A224YEE5_9ACAR